MESIPGLLKRVQIRAQATLDSGIVSLESILELLKRLQIRAQATIPWNRFLGSIKVLKIPPLFVLLRSSSFFCFDFAISGIRRVRSALIFRICGINRLRFILSNLWNKQTSLRFDLSNLWNKQSSLRFDL